MMTGIVGSNGVDPLAAYLVMIVLLGWWSSW